MKLGGGDDRDDRLVALALGLLDEAEARALETELAASPELQDQRAEIDEILARAAELSLPPAEPTAAARARLLQALEGPDRFQPFLAELARRFDMAADAMRAVLARIDDALAWEEGPLPWIKLIHFQSGPGAASADTGLLRMTAGSSFPRHRHLGPEMTMVLEGTMIDGDRRYGPGEMVEWPVDTIHDYSAGPDRDLVIIVGYNGIEPTG